jgi:hypothetical protein
MVIGVGFPLKPKLIRIIFKVSVRTSKRTPHFTVKNIKWLTLFKGTIAVYSKNHTKSIHAKCKLLITEHAATYSYYSALNVNI